MLVDGVCSFCFAKRFAILRRIALFSISKSIACTLQFSKLSMYGVTPCHFNFYIWKRIFLLLVRNFLYMVLSLKIFMHVTPLWKVVLKGKLTGNERGATQVATREGNLSLLPRHVHTIISVVLNPPHVCSTFFFVFFFLRLLGQMQEMR